MYMRETDTADFVGCFAGNLRAAARVVSRRYDTALRDTGLRITQVAVLAQVQRLAPVSLTRLSDELAVERSVIARDVAVLERDGLLSVATDSNDRRARSVTMTREGVRRLRGAAPAWQVAQQELRNVLGAGPTGQLLEGCRHVVDTLR